MSAFKAAYINSQCCNHFSIHTAHTVTLVANSRRAGLQLVLQSLQRCSVTRGASPHVSTSLEPAIHRRHTRHGTRRFAARVARRIARPAAHGDVSITMPDEIRQPVAPRPVVLSTSSAGARLRCVSAIWPFRVWRRVLFHWSDRSGHAGGIGRG